MAGSSSESNDDNSSSENGENQSPDSDSEMNRGAKNDMSSSPSSDQRSDSDDDDDDGGGRVGQVEDEKQVGRDSDASSVGSSSSDRGDESDRNDDVGAPDGRLRADPGATNRNRSSSQQPVMLSKSWRILSSHVPMYTGGRFVVVPSPHTLATTPPSAGSTVDSDARSLGHPRGDSPHLLLLPVGGNVAMVDLRSGTVISKLRDDRMSGSPLDDDNDDDDELGHDPDSITAFDCTSSIIVTCSHNSILRQYAIEYPNGEGSGESSLLRPAATTRLLRKTIGKSGHSLPVTVLSFHPSGVYFATGSLDATVRVWDLRGGYCTHSFRWSGGGGGGVRSGVSCISWKKRQSSGKDLRLAIGREDGSIVVHDLLRPVDAPPVAVLHDHVSAVTCIEWLQTLLPLKRGESSVLLSSGRDSVLNLWVGDRSVHTLPVYEQVEGLVVVEGEHHGGSGVVVATAGSKGVVRLWKVSSSFRIEPVMVQLSGTSTEDRGGYVALQQYHEKASGRKNDDVGGHSIRLVVANAEHQISVLDCTSLQTLHTLVGHLDDILDVRILPSIDLETLDKGISRVAIATNSAEIRLMTVSTSDNDAAAGTSSTTTTLTGHAAAVLCLDVSPCGAFMLSCGKDRTVRVWQLGSHQCVATASGHTEAVGAAAFSRKAPYYRQPPNDTSSFCVSVSVDRTLKRWNLPRAVLVSAGNDVETLSAVATVRAHEKDINMVAVAPNDSLVATASQDKTVRLWNASDLSLRTTLKGHRRGVWDVQFSPVDRVVATASGDKTLKLWSLTDYSCVRTFQGHLSTVLRVRFLSCGLQLLSSGADGLIKLWTIRTNECEATLDAHSHKVWALDVRDPSSTASSLPSGARPLMVSGGGDSRLVAWIDTTVQEAQARRDEMHENVLLDQQLANHLRRKQYGEALRIALRRDKPLQALKVLTSIIESDLAQNLPNRNGFPAVQAVAKGWSDDELLKVLRYCREWNSRARNCHVAMVVVNAVVSSTPLSRLAAINGVPEVLGGILVYAERHRDRLDRLRTSSYLLDFVLSNMGSLDKAGSAPAGADDGTVDAATGAVVAEFAEWEQRTMGRRLVLPPKHVDGRIQVGGTAVVGGRVGGAVRTVEAKRGGGGGDDDDPMGVSSDGSIESVVADDSDDSSSQSASSGR